MSAQDTDAWEPPEGFAPLFNGKDLTGWEGNLDFFRLKDGAILAGAVSNLKLYPGVEATLFASEPVMVSPRNIHIGHRGRVWADFRGNFPEEFS